MSGVSLMLNRNGLKAVVGFLNGTFRTHSSAVLIPNKGWKLGSLGVGIIEKEWGMDLDVQSRNIQNLWHFLGNRWGNFLSNRGAFGVLEEFCERLVENVYEEL